MHRLLPLAAAILAVRLTEPTSDLPAAALAAAVLLVISILYWRQRRRIRSGLKIGFPSGQLSLEPPDGPPTACELSRAIVNPLFLAPELALVRGGKIWLLLFRDAFAPGDFRRLYLLLRDRMRPSDSIAERNH